MVNPEASGPENDKSLPSIHFYVAAGFAILAAIAMRSWINFSTALPPQVDSAYYPLQAREILESWHLAYHDLPFFFILNAGFAKLLMLFAGMDIDAAILLSSRLLDSILEPLITVVIFGLGLSWARQLKVKANPWLLSISLGSCALLATVSQPIMTMTSNFQKNSLGLVCLAAFAWTLYEALHRGGWKRWTLAAATLGLAGLTHVGAFGATLVLAAGALTAYFVIARKPSLKQVAATFAIAFAVAGLLLLLIYSLSPRRALSLLSAPLEIFGAKQGGPPGMRFGLFACVPVYLLVTLGIWRLWKERLKLSSAETAIMLGISLSALLLACPMLKGEYQMRLMLMSPVPAALILAFIALRTSQSWKWLPLPLIVGVLSLGSGLLASGLIKITWSMGGQHGRMDRGFGGPPPMMGGNGEGLMTEKAADELRSLRKLIDNPSKTVVLAQMGLNWWAGFLIHVPVRENHSATSTALEKYERILVLERKGGFGPEHGGGPGVPPDMMPGMMPPRDPPPDFRRDDNGQDRQRMQPPPFRRMGENAMVQDLSKAKLLHDGESFKLYELKKD